MQQCALNQLRQSVVLIEQALRASNITGRKLKLSRIIFGRHASLVDARTSVCLRGSSPPLPIKDGGRRPRPGRYSAGLFEDAIDCLAAVNFEKGTRTQVCRPGLGRAGGIPFHSGRLPSFTTAICDQPAAVTVRGPLSVQAPTPAQQDRVRSCDGVLLSPGGSQLGGKCDVPK
jgi:hypothetical protein